MALKNICGKVMKLVKDHDTTILTGLTIAGTIVAVVTAWNARPKCERILDELNAKGATNGEKAKALAPVVAPTVIATAVSVGCALAHEKTTGDRISGLINTASTLATASDIRKAAEQNVVGPEKAEEIDKVVAKEVVESTPVEEIEKTGHGDTIFLEQNTGKIFRASKDYVELGFVKANTKLAACYDKYGLCKNDEFEFSMAELLREWGIRQGDFARLFVFRAKDHKEIQWQFVPFEYSHEDGTTELGYVIDILTPVSLSLYQDSY